MTTNKSSNDSRPKKVMILSTVHMALDNRVFYREARSLASAGYDVTLVAVHDRDELREGVQIIGLPRVPRWQRPKLWRRVLALATDAQADIYHFHDPELLLVSPFIRRRTKRPTVYDIHEVYPEFVEVKDYLPGWLRRPLAGLVRVIEPALARHESGLLFADDAIARAFAAYAGPKATLFNYPDLSHFAISLSSSPERNSSTVLYLGGMEVNRGVLLMLEAFARVVAALPAARLHLVGHFAPPTLETEVRHLIQTLGLEEAVEVVGRVPFDAVSDYLRAAAVGWVPWQAARKNELNIPTKLFEYMVAGLPVVASDLASIRPFVRPGDTGLLVPAADARAHADAILDLLQHPDETRAMGERGRHLVTTTFNWAAMEPRLLAFYETVLARADRNGRR